MEKYKQSKYNLISNVESEMIIYNTLNSSFLRFDEETSKKVKEILNNIDMYYGTSLFELLVNNKIIIPNTYCEKTELDNLKKSAVSNNEELNLILFPTEKCNFRCSYCYEDFNKPKMSSDIQEGIITFLTNNLEGYKRLNIDWFGGEPLVEIDLIEDLSKKIIELCKKYKVAFIAGMTTNGYNLDLLTLKRLQKCRIYRYQITIDGLKDTHDNQRMLKNYKGSWDRIISNLRDIRDYNKSGYLLIALRTNITRQIHEKFREYLDFLEKEFSKDNRFKYLFRLAADWGNMNDENIKSQFCTVEEYLEDLAYSLSRGFYNVGVKNCLVPAGLLCYAWKENSFIVRADGVISKCTLNLYDSMNKISHIDEFDLNNKNDTWDFATRGIHPKCVNCIKYPVCLKVNCNMMSESEIECEPEMERLETLIGHISNENYKCNYIKIGDY